MSVLFHVKRKLGNALPMMWLLPRAFARLTAQRAIDDRVTEVERIVPRRLRRRELGVPEVLGDAVLPGVAVADPHDPTLIVDLVRLAVAALRLHGARHVAAGLVELATPDAAVLVDRHTVLHVLAGGDQEEVAGPLARAAGLEVFGNEQLA